MANTLFVGKVYLRFAALASTNDFVRERLAPGTEAAKNKPPEGMVVRADTQSAGRGQFGSLWESEAGANLTLSVLLRPVWLGVGEQFWLSVAMALGVRDAVERTMLAQGPELTPPPPTPPLEGRGVCPQQGLPPSPPGEGLGGGVSGLSPELRLKWPNDLYLGDRKAGGMLIENGLSGSKIHWSIIGIGLNINQLYFSENAPNATSLALETGRQFDLDAAAELLFACLERRYLQLKAGRRAGLRAEYLAALYRFGQATQFVCAADGAVFPGAIRGVTETGLLEIETAAGLERFEAKQVRFAL